MKNFATLEEAMEDDEFVTELMAALAQRLPKIITCIDDNGDIVVHLKDCPLAHGMREIKIDWSTEVSVQTKSCSCMPKPKDQH